METKEILDAIQNAAKTIATPNCAAVISAIASVGAVLVTIMIAIKQVGIAKKQNEIAEKQAEISEQQNKIALFKERYAVYCEVLKIINVSSQIKELGQRKKSAILHDIEIIFGISFSDEDNLSQAMVMLSQIKRSEYVIQQALFLFRGIEEKDVNELINAWMNCMSHLTRMDNLTLFDPKGTIEKSFIDKCYMFYSKYSNIIEKQLDLK